MTSYSSLSVQVAPKISMLVCASGRSYTPVAKQSCLSAARNKLRACPGCGDQLTLHAWQGQALCKVCRDLLERARAVKDPGPLRWVGIDARRLFGLSSGLEEEVVEKLACQLGQALGRSQRAQPETLERWEPRSFAPPPLSLSPSSTGYAGGCMVYVELPEERAEALREFAAGLSAIGQALHEEGQARGHDLLRRLANGEITVDAYEQARPPKG